MARRTLTAGSATAGRLFYNLSPARLSIYRSQTQPASSRPAFDHGNSFRGKPSRLDVPQLCGGCHANVEHMNPYGLRTDQLGQYKTSQHGIRLFAAQDTRVAVCIDCHNTHAVLAPSDPNSSVNVLNVPGTCGRCHGDDELMGKYDVPRRSSPSTRRACTAAGCWKGTIPACLRAPPVTATTGQQPPGFRDIGHVCAKCHQQTADYFNLSVHSRFSRLPACVECHSASGDPLDHRTFQGYPQPGGTGPEGRALL